MGLLGVSNVSRIVAMFDVFAKLPVSGVLALMMTFLVVPVHEEMHERTKKQQQKR